MFLRRSVSIESYNTKESFYQRDLSMNDLLSIYLYDIFVILLTTHNIQVQYSATFWIECNKPKIIRLVILFRSNLILIPHVA